MCVLKLGTKLYRIINGENPMWTAPPPSTTGQDISTVLRLLNLGNQSAAVRRSGGPEHVIIKSLSYVVVLCCYDDRNAVKFLTSTFGSPYYWKHGYLRPLFIKHAFHDAEPIGRSMSMGPLFVGGDPETILCHGESNFDQG